MRSELILNSPELYNEGFRYRNNKVNTKGRIDFEEKILRKVYEMTHDTCLDYLNVYYNKEYGCWIAQIYYKSDSEDIIELNGVDNWFDAVKLTAKKIGIPVR